LEVSAMTSGQARLVAAYLAVESPRAVRADELAEAIWTGRLPRTWEATLRGVVARVRRWLAAAGLDPLAAVETTPVGYRLCLPPEWTLDVRDAVVAARDAEALLRGRDWDGAAAAAARAALMTAMPFLPDHDGEWADQTRRRLHDLHARALEIEAVAHASAGDHDAALGAARRLVAADPFRETSQQLLMRTLAEGGDRAGAMLAYDAFASALRSELGVEPSPQTRAVRDRLVAEPEAASPRIARVVQEHLTPHTFVGRTDELARLARAWQRARSGTVTLVDVVGEAGIGKTSIAAQLARALFEDGASVLFGRCAPDPVVPYEPFVEAIEGHLESSTPPERALALAAAGSELAWVVPAVPSAAPAGPPRASPVERRRLFDAVGAYLRHVAGLGPVVLVVDDLHWASETTQLMLRHVVRRVRDSPVLVVLLERRPLDGAPEPRLRATLQELRRDPGLEEIELRGLGTHETQELVRAVAGHRTRARPPAGEELERAEWLRARCGGNPYFIGELVRGGRPLDPGLLAGSLPRSVTGMVEQHCHAAGPQATAVLQALAISGHHASLPLLQQVTGLDDDAFLDAVDAAIATGLVRRVGGTPHALSYAHSLARDAVDDLIPVGHGARLHRRVGEFLEAQLALGADVSPADLARHFVLAGTLGTAERAVRYTIAAARAELAAGAREDAAARVRAALGRAPAARARCDLLLVLGTALQQQGEALEARRAFVDAARLAVELDDDVALAEAALGASLGGHGVSGWEADPERIALLEQALGRIGGGRPAVRARLLAAVAETVTAPELAWRRQELADEAMEIAATSGHADAVVAALEASRIAWWDPRRTEARLAFARRVGDLAAGRDRELVVRAMLAEAVDLAVLGDRAALDEVLVRCRPVAEALGQVRYRWELALWDAGLALNDGRLDEVDEMARRAAAIWGDSPPPDAERALREQTAALRMLRGDVAEVLAGMGTATNIPAPARVAYDCARAATLLVAGRREEAAAVLAGLAADGYATLPRNSTWLFAACVLSDVAAAVGSDGEVERLLDVLRPHAGRMVLLAGPNVTWGCVDHHLGVLTARAGDAAAAVALLRGALAQHERFGAAPWAARSAAALAVLAG